MAIEISLFGFGDERPAAFGGGNRLALAAPAPMSPDALLRAAGFDETEGLVLIIDDAVIPAADWQRPLIDDGTAVTVLSAFEGG
jgi:sulfur carrier protein ThiS